MVTVQHVQWPSPNADSIEGAKYMIFFFVCPMKNSSKRLPECYPARPHYLHHKPSKSRNPIAGIGGLISHTTKKKKGSSEVEKESNDPIKTTRKER
jgi:hypothetical protein